MTPPALHDREPRAERHATWLELFFDLVFVVAVAELGHLLAGSLTPVGIVEFAALFVPVWWVWITHSYYGDVFDRGDTVYPLATVLVMLGVVSWSVTFHDAFHGGATAFVGAYLALRLLNVALYVFAGRTDPDARTLATRFTLGYALGLAFWVVSLALPAPTTYVLWAVGIAIEIVSTPAVYATLPEAPAQRSHMDERFGLFTIIVLGETIVGVAAGTTDTDWQAAATVTGVAGFAIAVGLWWLYFAYSDSEVVDRFVRSDWRGVARWVVYGYGHLPLFACLTAMGIGIETAIVAAGEGHALAAPARAILFGGAALFLVTVTVVQWAGPQVLSRRTAAARGFVAGVAFLFALPGDVADPLTKVVLLALLFVSLVIVEIPAVGSATEGVEQPM